VTRRRDLPPGPRMPPPLQVLGYYRRSRSFLDGCVERYGAVFTLHLGAAGPVVFVTSPEGARGLLSRDSVHGLNKGRRLLLTPVMGARSVFLQSGTPHLRLRRLMLPSFHGERIARQVELFDRITAEEVVRWPIGEPFALLPRLREITLSVILRGVFGTSSGPRERNLRTLVYDLLDRTASGPTQVAALACQLRGRAYPPLARSLGRVHEVLSAEIAERRRAGDLDRRDDVLSTLLAARDGDGRPLGDAELLDQLVTLLLAGHETTASALAWAFDALFRHPAVHARLRDELAAGDQRYLDAVVEEVLRTRPVVPEVGRRLGEPLEIDGHRLAPGTTVMVPILLLHLRRENYPDPLAFRPERFLDSPPTTYGWVPWGGGVHRCLGATFAQLEMQRVLRTAIGLVDLEPATERPEPIERLAATIVPRNGTPAIVARRRSPDASRRTAVGPLRVQSDTIAA
jgi:cytochrome P450